MSDNCGNICSGTDFEGISATYRKTLWVVVFINFTMFLVESVAGFIADSTALKADALDFLGDTATYLITLLVIGKPLRTRAKAALLKGVSLGGMAVFVLGYTIYKSVVVGQPEPLTIGLIGFIAFLANMASVLLLLKYRDGDSNIKSVWLCSRNDAIANIAVIIAGVGVFLTGNIWPDILVAFFIAGLFLHSSIKITVQALSEMKNTRV